MKNHLYPSLVWRARISAGVRLGLIICLLALSALAQTGNAALNSGHDILTGNFNRNPLTNSAIAPFSFNGSFGRLDPNNTNKGRTIRVAIRLGFYPVPASCQC